mmetsp:Transcript_25497/g.78696  ORF Transcript_25497/g.78696 Transcript_25497/m.78696 type:complete len:321 (+) Transcript_25497:782-1744(+)
MLVVSSMAHVSSAVVRACNAVSSPFRACFIARALTSCADSWIPGSDMEKPETAFLSRVISSALRIDRRVACSCMRSYSSSFFAETRSTPSAVMATMRSRRFDGKTVYMSTSTVSVGSTSDPHASWYAWATRALRRCGRARTEAHVVPTSAPRARRNGTLSSRCTHTSVPSTRSTCMLTSSSKWHPTVACTPAITLASSRPHRGRHSGRRSSDGDHGACSKALWIFRQKSAPLAMSLKPTKYSPLEALITVASKSAKQRCSTSVKRFTSASNMLVPLKSATSCRVTCTSSAAALRTCGRVKSCSGIPWFFASSACLAMSTR